jgi:hypothetical protein
MKLARHAVWTRTHARKSFARNRRRPSQAASAARSEQNKQHMEGVSESRRRSRSWCATRGLSRDYRTRIASEGRRLVGACTRTLRKEGSSYRGKHLQGAVVFWRVVADESATQRGSTKYQLGILCACGCGSEGAGKCSRAGAATPTSKARANAREKGGDEGSRALSRHATPPQRRGAQRPRERLERLDENAPAAPRPQCVGSDGAGRHRPARGPGCERADGGTWAAEGGQADTAGERVPSGSGPAATAAVGPVGARTCESM